MDPQGRVLITRRHDHQHQGGLWEFPGGKLEPGEMPREGLARELYEEVGIRVTAARPLIRVSHDYSDRSVLLDVWRVDAFTGEAHGREQQPFAWVAPDELSTYQFPAANKAIVAAVQLPDRYLITPEPGADKASFLRRLEAALQRGIRLVQLRAKRLSDDDYLRLAHEAQALCARFAARLLLNAEPELVPKVGAAGAHLSAARLLALRSRPLSNDYCLAASCHTAEELAHAAAIGVDFVVLSPVEATHSHPQAKPLGWAQFQALSDHAPMPVYALGGMGVEDLPAAWAHGAQGIAAIRRLWD